MGVGSRVLTLASVTLLVAAASIGIAGVAQDRATDETPPPSLHQQLEPFRPLLGKSYKGRFSSSTPERPAVDAQKWERALNGNAVRLLHSVNDGAYGGETFFLWDEAKATIVYHYFTTAGFTTTGTLRFEGSTWTSHEVVQGSGTAVTEVKAIATLLPDGRLSVRTRLLENNEWKDGETIVYTETPDAEVVFR